MVNHKPGRTPHQSASGGYKKSLQTSCLNKKLIATFISFAKELAESNHQTNENLKAEQNERLNNCYYS